MQRKIWAGVALLSLAPGAFAAPAAIAAPAAPASDLAIATDFFMPRAPIETFIREACSSTFRTRLTTVNEEIAIGHEIPGIHDAMIARMTEYCDTRIGPMIDILQDNVRTRIVAAFTPAEIGRISANFGFAVDEVLAMKVDVRDGDTATEAAKRTMAGVQIDEARFEHAQQALARAPGGAALVNKIAAMQKMLGGEMQTKLRLLFRPLIADALVSAHRAGNDYAVSRGRAAPYIVD